MLKQHEEDGQGLPFMGKMARVCPPWGRRPGSAFPGEDGKVLPSLGFILYMADRLRDYSSSQKRQHRQKTSRWLEFHWSTSQLSGAHSREQAESRLQNLKLFSQA